jgi:hypothetical protein
MTFSAYFDTSGFGFLLIGFSLLLAAGYFLLVIVLFEAILLRAMKWASFSSCLLNSFIANLVSLFAGYFLSRGVELITGMDATALIEKSFWIYLIANWIASVLIEGTVLSLRSEHGLAYNLRTAGLVNIASYIPNGLVFWLLAQ